MSWRYFPSSYESDVKTIKSNVLSSNNSSLSARSRSGSSSSLPTAESPGGSSSSPMSPKGRTTRRAGTEELLSARSSPLSSTSLSETKSAAERNRGRTPLDEGVGYPGISDGNAQGTTSSPQKSTRSPLGSPSVVHVPTTGTQNHQSPEPSEPPPANGHRPHITALTPMDANQLGHSHSQSYPDSFSNYLYELVTGLSSHPDTTHPQSPDAKSSARTTESGISDLFQAFDSEPDAFAIPPANHPSASTGLFNWLSGGTLMPPFENPVVDFDRTDSPDNFREMSNPIPPEPTEEELQRQIRDTVLRDMPPLKFEGRYGVSDPVVSDALADKLRRHFPPLQRESTKWTLIYSLEMHGISLNTLFDRAQRKGPCVLCLRDQWGNVFGAYLSESPYVRKGYYGTGTCFLWKQTPQPSDPTHIKVFKSTGRKEYYILSEGSFLSVGGGDGRYGLYVDSSLDRGHSEKCLTFENETLSGAQEFNCVGCELWGFKM